MASGCTALRNWRERSGLGDLHVHDLRHTAATRLREAEVPERTISDILWHATANMTGHYARGSVRELIVALEKITDERYSINPTISSIAQGPRG